MPDSPYIPAQVPVVTGSGRIASTSWLLYQQAQDRRLNALSALGLEHVLATHAARLVLDAGTFPGGTLVVETDRCCLIYGAGVVSPDHWSYVAGVWSAALAQLPADLTAYDEGLLFAATDLNHLLRWDGTGWTWAPPDSGSGYFVTRPAASVPETPGWQLCDGSATTVLSLAGARANLVPVVTPVVANQYLRR